MSDRSAPLASLAGEGRFRCARAHQEAIDRFGRFPRRNDALGRESTAAEREWLAAGGGFLNHHFGARWNPLASRDGVRRSQPASSGLSARTCTLGRMSLHLSRSIALVFRHH